MRRFPSQYSATYIWLDVAFAPPEWFEAGGPERRSYFARLSPACRLRRLNSVTLTNLLETFTRYLQTAAYCTVIHPTRQIEVALERG